MKLFKRWLKRFSYLVATILGLLVAMLLVFYLWFPNLAGHKGTIEEFLTAELEQPVVIQHLDTRWQGLRLSFVARGVRVRGVKDTQSALRLGELRMVVNPLPLLLGRVRLNTLVISGITVELLRDESGQIKVAELEKIASGSQPRLGAAAWWFRQQNVLIENATVVWRDARDPGREFQFTDITLSITRNGEQRDLTGSARLPKGMGNTINISGRLDGLPAGGNAWEGVLEFAFTGLNIAELPQVIAERLPGKSIGRMDARLSTSLVNGRPVGGVGEISITDFAVPHPKSGKPLNVKRFQSEVSWHRDETSWRVLLLHPELDAGRLLKIDQIEVDWVNDVYTLRSENVDLANLVSVIRESKVKLPWQYVLDRVKPAGTINSAKITVAGKLGKPDDWDFEGEFKELSWEPYRHFPGLSGVRGKLQMDPQQGRLVVRAGDVELDFPQVLRQPVRFPRLRGNIAWSRDQQNWSVHITKLELANQDIEVAEGSVLARLPVNPGPSPYIDAQAKVVRLDLAGIKKYLPTKIMKPKAIKWTDHAFVGGRATDGLFTLRGHIKDFPFKDDVGGEFRFTTQVDDGVLLFDPDWPPLKEVKANVLFDNEWFRVKAEHAVYMNSVVSRATAVSEELFLKQKPKLLQIEGDMQAKVADVTQFLTRGPLIKKKGKIPEMRGSGLGQLKLKLDLPLGELKENSKVSGVYSFENADVALVKTDIGMQGLSGTVSFTEQTVSGQNLQARMLDGPVTLEVASVEPRKPPHFAIDFKGKGNVKGLAPVLSHSLVGFLQGKQVPWNGRLEVDDGRAVLSVHSAGTGLVSELPAPLTKNASERWDIAASAVFEHDTRNIEFNVADRLNGVLLMRKDGEKAYFDRGRIAVNKGKQSLPDEPGVEIAAAVADFDVDAWIKAWQRGREFAQASGKEKKDDDNLVDALRMVRLDARALRFLGRELKAMQLEAHSTESLDWVARLSGETASGAARARFYRDKERSPDFKFVLEKLYWPKGLERNDKEKKLAEKESPEEYPHLAIDVDDFRYGTWRLGGMRLRAAPKNNSWRIERFTTQHPALSVTGSGYWRATPQQQTTLTFVVTSQDSGEALAQLGYPNQVAGGKATLTGNLRWPGSPGKFRFEHLDGEVELEAKKGRFLQIEPGSGRLMGLFNLDALARRMTFDFTDVFSKGLAFDRINAEARIAQGDLFSEGVYIVGPAAMIEARGRAGLDDEDYDMELIVAPDVGGNLTLLSALANPAAGAVVFVVQKLFKKQLAKVVHYRYQVNGPWDNPDVVRLRRDPAPDLDTTDDATETGNTKDQ